MSKLHGYICDGCNTNLVTQEFESLSQYGWLQTFMPVGMRTLHTCSDLCLIHALGGTKYVAIAR